MKGSSILWLRHQPWIQQIHIWFLTLPQIFWEALGLSQKPRSIFVWHELRKIFRISCLCCCSSQRSAREISKESTTSPYNPWSDSHSGGVPLPRRNLRDNVGPDTFKGDKIRWDHFPPLSQPPTCTEVMAMPSLLFWSCWISFKERSKMWPDFIQALLTQFYK